MMKRMKPSWIWMDNPESGWTPGQEEQRHLSSSLSFPMFESTRLILVIRPTVLAY